MIPLCYNAMDVYVIYKWIQMWWKIHVNELNVMIYMPLENVVFHLVYDTIVMSWDMCEWNEIKLSNQIFSTKELSKEGNIVYPIQVVQLGDKQLGV